MLVVVAATVTFAQLTEAQRVELNTQLVESTFRLEGGDKSGAVKTGTGFVLGRPYPNNPQRARWLKHPSADIAVMYVRPPSGPQTLRAPEIDPRN